MRETKRKKIIHRILQEQCRSTPCMLSVLRSVAHRRERCPRAYADFVIDDAYEKSFNRTVRTMKSRFSSYQIDTPISELYAGIAATSLISQAMHKGYYRSYPKHDSKLSIFLFHEMIRVDVGLTNVFPMWWLSGAILRKTGSLLRVGSLPISLRPTFVFDSHPTWGDIKKCARVSWDIHYLTKNGAENILSEEQLVAPYIREVEMGVKVTFKGIEINRHRAKPPREILFPQYKLNRSSSFVEDNKIPIK